MKVGVCRARLPLWGYKVAQSLFGLSMWSLLGVWGCSLVQECCWEVCEKSVMGFVLLSVCQSLLNLMFWDFKLVVLLSVIWVGKGTPKACHTLVPV